MKRIAGLCAAMMISTLGLPEAADQASNLIEEVSVVGCIREWRPAPDDITRFPEPKQPGIYLLTPIASSPTVVTDLPTYLLTPSMAVNFEAHLNDKVEVVGTAQAAPLPPTVQDTVTAPTRRPEERPTVQGMPRLTVRTLKKVSDACPS